MANAVILFGGKVKQATNLSDITFNNKSGFVASFMFKGKKYTHCYPKNYLNEKAPAIDEGYYYEQDFLKYLAKTILPDVLSAGVFQLKKIADAVNGDVIKVSKLRVVDPYDEFCKINTYSWPYDSTQDVIDGDSNIVIPDITPEKVNVPLAPQLVYEFYNRNILLVKSSDFQDDRNESAYSLAIIALQIYRINKDIFPLFNQSPELAAYIETQNNHWANGIIFDQPTYEDILQYEESLTNYYNTAYSNQLFISSTPKSTKLLWLAIILSPSGLAVLPVDLKVTILKKTVEILATDYMTYGPYSPFRDIVDSCQQIILNIVESIIDTPTVSDYFLKQMFVTVSTDQSKDVSLFEALYKRLEDNRKGRLTHQLINGNNNKKNFIQSLYNIWKISQYNPYYNSPSYTQPANSKTKVYPESFFIANKEYYDSKLAPSTLTYKTSSRVLDTYGVTYEFSLINNSVVKVLKITTSAPSVNAVPGVQLYGVYNVYQPLSLLGYQQDPIAFIPSFNCIPAFYLYYAYDARQTANFDFGVLAIIEVALNFTILGELEGITYLEELSGIAEAETLPGSTRILSWDSILGISREVQFTAGNFSVVLNFIKNTSPDIDPKMGRYIEALDIFLGALTMAATISDFVAQIKLVASASAVKAAAGNLNEDIRLPYQVENAIELLGNIDELVDLMTSKLDQLSLSSVNTLKSKFIYIEDAERQLGFFNDFYFVEDTDVIWNELNTTYNETVINPDGTLSLRSLIDDWKEIEELQKYRSDIGFLIPYRHISKDTSLLKHILEGEFKGTKVVGIHCKIAENYGCKIDQIVVPQDNEGFYKCFVSKEDVNGVYIAKVDGRGRLQENSMFPDDWNKQKIIEEISFAYKNKVYSGRGNQWFGTMSNGRTVTICINGNAINFDATTVVKTVWPNM